MLEEVFNGVTQVICSVLYYHIDGKERAGHSLTLYGCIALNRDSDRLPLLVHSRKSAQMV